MARARKRIIELQGELAKVEKDRDKWKAALQAWERHNILDSIVRLDGTARLVLPRPWEPMVRLMRAGLHADRTRGDDKWFKLFDAIKVTFVDEPKGKPRPKTASELRKRAAAARKARAATAAT